MLKSNIKNINRYNNKIVILTLIIQSFSPCAEISVIIVGDTAPSCGTFCLQILTSVLFAYIHFDLTSVS